MLNFVAEQRQKICKLEATFRRFPSKDFFVISLTVPPRVERVESVDTGQSQLHEDFSTQKLELTTPPWGLLQVPSKFESFRSFRPSVWSYYLINTGTCDRCDHPSDANRRRRQPIFIRVWCPLVSGCFILNSQKISPRRCGLLACGGSP